jgi:hypothetical protein
MHDFSNIDIDILLIAANFVGDSDLVERSMLLTILLRSCDL